MHNKNILSHFENESVIKWENAKQTSITRGQCSAPSRCLTLNRAISEYHYCNMTVLKIALNSKTQYQY